MKVVFTLFYLFLNFSVAQAEYLPSCASSLAADLSLRVNTPDEEAAALKLASEDFLPELPQADAIAELQDLEKVALEAMYKLLPKNHAQSQEPLRDWLSTFRARQEAGQSPVVMWHNALTYGLRSGLFEKIADPEIILEAKSLLRHSWKDLTGKDVKEANINGSRLRKIGLKISGRKNTLLT